MTHYIVIARKGNSIVFQSEPIFNHDDAVQFYQAASVLFKDVVIYSKLDLKEIYSYD